jgi:hypothetical protein
VRIRFGADAGAPASLSQRFEIVEVTPRLWNVRVQGELGELLEAAQEFPIRDIEIETPRLEDVIVSYYRGVRP